MSTWSLPTSSLPTISVPLVAAELSLPQYVLWVFNARGWPCLHSLLPEKVTVKTWEWETEEPPLTERFGLGEGRMARGRICMKHILCCWDYSEHLNSLWFPWTEWTLGCGFQMPDPALPSLDEVDAGEQPPAAFGPTSRTKVRGPFLLWEPPWLFFKVTEMTETWDSTAPSDNSWYHAGQCGKAYS